MMNISSKILRFNSNKYVSIIITDIGFAHDEMTLKLKDGIEIVSTSVGFIKDNIVIILKPTREIEIAVSAPIDVSNIEGVLTFYQRGLVKTEPFNVILSVTKTNNKLSENKPVEIRTIKTNLLTGYSNLDQYVKTVNIVKWSLKLTINENINVDIIHSDNRENIYTCFGDMSTVVNSGDLVFVLNKGHSTVIPKEIPWIKYKEYKGYVLGCFEIVSLDCDSINNIFYKIPISNTVNVSDLTVKNEVNLSNFVDPLNRKFSTDLWEVSKQSNLLVAKKHE